jgi:hypothetical protein
MHLISWELVMFLVPQGYHGYSIIEVGNSPGTHSSTEPQEVLADTSTGKNLISQIKMKQHVSFWRHITDGFGGSTGGDLYQSSPLLHAYGPFQTSCECFTSRKNFNRNTYTFFAILGQPIWLQPFPKGKGSSLAAC